MNVVALTCMWSGCCFVITLILGLLGTGRRADGSQERILEIISPAPPTSITEIICLGTTCIALLISATQARCDTYDDDTTLEFYWSAASGSVRHYNVYLSIDEGDYFRVGTTPITPTEGEPYIVPVDAEDGKRYQLKVEAVDAQDRTGPMSEPSDIVWCRLSKPISNVQETTIALAVGWNLISFNIQPTPDTFDYILASIQGKYDAIWTYDATIQEWLRYAVDGSPLLNNLNMAEAGIGYWLKMNQAVRLTVQGTPMSTTVQLRTGWNLVGYNSQLPQAVERCISSIEGKYDSVWAYDPDQGKWFRYIPDAPAFLNSLKFMVPGRGYWIYAREECVWDVP